MEVYMEVYMVNMYTEIVYDVYACTLIHYKCMIEFDHVYIHGQTPCTSMESIHGEYIW